MKKEWNTVEVLRHARHDWLNKLQLIKGNLSLNKVDRVFEIIDEIVVETQQESKLSNMNIPQFASLLFTYNWENYQIQLEYEILGEHTVGAKKINDVQLTDWTIVFFEHLHTVIESLSENHLSITVEPQQTGIRFFFDFRGIIVEQEQLLFFLQKQSPIEKKVQQLSEQELALEIYMPFL
ncbi:Spo0B C-terminal domain-containing protein [Bacillus dakarensis]|uniref:Spo0B C-terminal domain-containing protein n=1 Tax=Robertmurraya dakarensis TaxID=1926278 RepID=UPI000980FF5A|nr:Spo0B C-terminal domain-containing protein [Bacillus dakarensis]